jgi:hypothetical protein
VKYTDIKDTPTLNYQAELTQLRAELEVVRQTKEKAIMDEEALV